VDGPDTGGKLGCPWGSERKVQALKVFLTGGTGLVGREVVDMLVGRGDEVVCLSRDPASARAGLPDAAEVIGGDPNLPGDWQDRLAACDAVINLAGDPVGQGFWTAAKKRRLRRSRLAVTENVVQALAARQEPVVLVNASAVGYYGDRGDEALAETAEPGQDFLARLAVEWEHTALKAEREGARVALLRLGIVLAAEGGALAKMLPPFRLGLGGPMGSGHQYLPWIHLHDVARIIVFILDNDAVRGPVNAVVGDPPLQKDFASALGRALGKPSVMPLPAFVLRLMLGEKAALLLASQRAVPNALKAAGFRFEFAELDRALADLV
jgi:uncharacterized protein (TIGR01777 family)